MTQILTTERQQFEEYFNDFYGCHPTDHHDPIHVEGIWHAWQDGNTRAANREAQPLGYIDPGNLKTYRGVMAGGSWSPVKRTLSGLNLTLPIYLSAPPAPAVPDDLIMQVRRLVHALKNPILTMR